MDVVGGLITDILFNAGINKNVMNNFMKLNEMKNHFYMKGDGIL